MGHMISSFGEGDEYPDLLVVGSAILALAESHKVLRESARLALNTVSGLPLGGSWASSAKDIRVWLPRNECDRPVLLKRAKPDHNLTEVVNLCATVERLIDALLWCDTHYPTYKISVCHPSTGSGKNGKRRDDDLVLQDGSDIALRFEATDNSGSGNTTAKIRKDLDSLFFAEECYPNDRRFLVVRKAPADCLDSFFWYFRLVRNGNCRFLVREVHERGCSGILEVARASAPDGHSV